MSTFYEIPLSPQPQNFGITLAGVDYELLLKWCPAAACWVLDIADSNGTPIVRGVALVTGVDLLGQYGYLNFNGVLFAFTDHDLTTPPTFDNLGLTGHLYFAVAD